MNEQSSKFYGEQDDRHGGKLHWPGANGLPFRGKAVPNLRQQEFEELPIVADYHAQWFDLSKPEDAKYFNWVQDRIMNGMFIREHILRHPDAEKMRMIVWLEWRQLYVQASAATRFGGSNGRATGSFTLRG